MVHIQKGERCLTANIVINILGEPGLTEYMKIAVRLEEKQTRRKTRDGSGMKMAKEILINLRVTKNLKYWLKKNKLSPTKIFYDAIKKLGYEGD